jgi:hypothetical protein
VNINITDFGDYVNNNITVVLVLLSQSHLISLFVDIIAVVVGARGNLPNHLAHANRHTVALVAQVLALWR